MSFLDFTDQVILITGASRGVGAAAAVGFARAGAAGVVVNYRGRREAALEVAAEVERAGAAALVPQADVARADEARSLVNQTLERFGRLDVLVANAGIWPASGRPVTDLDAAQWAETIRVNLDGVYHVCREAARVFARERRGNIVTVSSTAGQRGEAGHADYAASKGAVISLTKSLAAELGPGGVRVNSVAPGGSTPKCRPRRCARARPTSRDSPGDPARPRGDGRGHRRRFFFLASDLARHTPPTNDPNLQPPPPPPPPPSRASRPSARRSAARRWSGPTAWPRPWASRSCGSRTTRSTSPTLSFKDRVVSVALTKAREFGFKTVGCASTGNLANSVAANAAAAGLEPTSSSRPTWSGPRSSAPASTART